MRIDYPNQRKIFLITITLCFLCYVVVYLSGGTHLSFPHLFYFPILIASQFGDWKTALTTSIFSSILMSKWLIPLDVSQGIMQSNYGWLFRSVMYITIAIAIKISTDKIQERNRSILKKSRNLFAVQKATFIGMLNLAETRDSETTGNHLERLGFYAEVLLRDISISDELKKNIITCIPFHDIGKVAIPDTILLKPDKLTVEEFDIIKQHTIIGGKIIEDIEKLTPVDEKEIHEMIKITKEIIYYHHERPDGRGYPFGIKCEDIPFSAKVTSICDVYDALVSERPYKKPIAHEECVKIILAGRGSQFDEALVDRFLKVNHEFKSIYENFRKISEAKINGFKSINA